VWTTTITPRLFRSWERNQQQNCGRSWRWFYGTRERLTDEGLASESHHYRGADRCQTIFNACSFFGPSQRSENLRFASQSADKLRTVCAVLFFEYCNQLAIARFQLVGLAPFVVESANIKLG
jgi:hypothetical protein